MQSTLKEFMAGEVAGEFIWHEYPLENFSLSLEMDRETAQLGEDHLRAMFSWRMARLPELGVLRLPDGWREGLKEAAYNRASFWGARRGLAALGRLAVWARKRWPVRYRTWEALALVPGLHRQPLPPGRGSVIIPIFRPATGRAA